MVTGPGIGGESLPFHPRCLAHSRQLHANRCSPLSSMDDRCRHLLALCAVRDANWHVIAREASKPDGLTRLLELDFAEASTEAKRTRAALRKALKDPAPYLARADEEIDRAAATGARLVT